ncbi:calmodulin-binding protein 60 A-like isoform X2 [Andrographis paniculata]|uniref:calmodulin-binding protein 60 A-like isoform X2 n=1 Tax=Andrographis paniculata TaxID=175694 RepID=UPI0021E7748A|nr:calmodulin-binding protein 60 A-like isoform X2 [Andrographis paniculata]
MELSESSQPQSQLFMVEDELNLLKKKIQTRINGLKSFDSMNFFWLVEEEFNMTKKKIQTRSSGIDNNDDHGKPFKQLKLQFTNKISPAILTGDEIKGVEDTFLEIALIDVSTGNIIEASEPEASTNIEIVLLKKCECNNLTIDEFDENILHNPEGKESLLVGNTHVKLENGIGVLKQIKLKHRTKKINPPEFCLGARVVDPVYRDRIMPATTESFMVQNYRKKYYKKHEIPALTDEVYRLVNIHKDGKIAERLRDEKIKTVEDFLIRHLFDPQGLKNVVSTAPKKWKDIVANARACRDKRIYCYADFQQKTAVVFNVLGQVLWQHSNNQFALTDEDEAREFSLQSAYEHWNDVKHFDDESSLEEYLNSLRESWGPPNARMMEETCVDDYDIITNDADIYFVVRKRHWRVFRGIWRWTSVIKKKIGKKCCRLKKLKVRRQEKCRFERSFS